MRIGQLMSQPAVTCSAEDSLHRAAQLMWDHDCGVLPVVDPQGRTIGVITDRDVCMAAYTQGRPLHEIVVRSAMARDAFCCRTEDSLETAAKTMSEKQIRRVPVVDGEGRPIGVLSMNDLAREASRTRNRDSKLEHDVASTLARICEPRQEQLSTPTRALAAASGAAP
jgi:CBS-domain-containing membrane protein